MGFFCLELYTFLPLTEALKPVILIKKKENALPNVFKSRDSTLLKIVTIYPTFKQKIHAVKFLCNLKDIPFSLVLEINYQKVDIFNVILF